MGDCLFCAIAAGDIPSTKIFENERVVAFLDINPLQQGHALVIPRAHAAKLEDASPGDAAAVMQAAQQLAPVICEAVACSDSTIAINNGPDAGQEVGHLHLHIVPRRQGDAAGPVHALFAERPTPDANELAALATKITDALEESA